MFSQMHAEQRRILKAVSELVYYMRGSVQYSDMLLRSAIEREVMTDFINERLEVERNNPYPTY